MTGWEGDAVQIAEQRYKLADDGPPPEPFSTVVARALDRTALGDEEMEYQSIPTQLHFITELLAAILGRLDILIETLAATTPEESLQPKAPRRPAGSE